MTYLLPRGSEDYSDRVGLVLLGFRRLGLLLVEVVGEWMALAPFRLRPAQHSVDTVVVVIVVLFVIVE